MQRALGFSLIELVIVTVVIGIMAAVLSPLMLSSLRAYDDTLGDVVVLDKLRYATERLAREIRGVQYASSTTTPPTTCSDGTSDKYCITSMTATGLTFRICTAYDFTANPTSCPAYRTVTIGTTTTPSASCVAVSPGNAACVTLAYSDVAGNAAQVLTNELGAASNLAFAYYQQDGITPATLAGNANCMAVAICVSYVEISLTLSHNGNPYIQRTRVDLRNPPT